MRFTHLPLSNQPIGELTSSWAEQAQLPYFYSPETGSTNIIAKDQAFEAKSLEEPVQIFITDNQTKGRGRGTHSWQSPPHGGALLSSWSFFVQECPRPQFSLYVGLAVYRALSSSWPFLPWSLKAPNDIYLGDHKTAGLLIENLIEGSHKRLIIGLGINVTAQPTEVANATCLAHHHQDILVGEWLSFLDRLLLELSMAVAIESGASAQSQDEKALLYALNQYPHKPAIFTKIDSEGNLHSKGSTIKWSEL